MMIKIKSSETCEGTEYFSETYETVAVVKTS